MKKLFVLSLLFFSQFGFAFSEVTTTSPVVFRIKYIYDAFDHYFGATVHIYVDGSQLTEETYDSGDAAEVKVDELKGRIAKFRKDNPEAAIRIYPGKMGYAWIDSAK